jgi:AraC-like DNA-binding protein
MNIFYPKSLEIVYYILKIASVLAIFQMILLILFFNSKKNKNNCNKILSMILLVYAMQICAIVFMSVFPKEILVKYNLIPAFCNQFALLFGPLIWFYSKTIIDQKIGRWELLHISPFILMVIYMSVKKIVDPNHLFWFSSFRFYTSGLILVQSLIYILFTGYTIFRKKSLFKSYFNQSANSQTLYSFLLVGFILLWVLKFNTFFFMDIWKKYGVCPITTSSYFVTGFLFFNILVYIALIKPELFAWKKKYQNNNLTVEKKQQVINELIKNMEVEKKYSDSSLTLTILAKELEISVPYLSQIINEEFHLNFPEFVNGYRIKEAERLLLYAQAEYTVQQILYKVGFNSKSAFYNAFKKHTGYTPSEIRQKAFN